MSIIELLLEYEADVNAHAFGQATPLPVVTYEQNVPILELLLQEPTQILLIQMSGLQCMKRSNKET